MANVPVVCSLGEAMIELVDVEQNDDAPRFAGDTYNTSVYLSRLGVPTQYVTAIGRDSFSEQFLDALKTEGIGAKYALRHPSRLMGMYSIETDACGERTFHYCRDQSAARRLFELDGHESALKAASAAGWLYITGITLSLFDRDTRARLGAVASAVKSNGGEVVFDPNYRPKGWQTPQLAREAISDFSKHVTIALPTLQDEDLLWGRSKAHCGTIAAQRHAARWFEAGAHLVVLKCGAEGAKLHEPGVPVRKVPVPHPISPIDTTGAGDSFNAGLIASLMRGHTLDQSTRFANMLAGVVIQHRGAIAPRDKTSFWKL